MSLDLLRHQMDIIGIFKVVNQLQHAWVVTADLQHFYLIQVKM